MAGLTVEVNGRVFDVTVSEAGSFIAKVDDEVYMADTLKKLRDKLKTSIAGHVQIPAILLSTGWRHNSSNEKLTLTPVTITGLHSGSHHDVLYRTADGRAHRRYNDSFLIPLTPEQIAELHTAYDALQHAQKAWDVLKVKWEMDVPAEVEKAAYLGQSEETPKPKRTKK